jgi:hypothetical protein
MKTLQLCLRTSLVPALLLASAASAGAQNWSGDARKIAMGGVGASENLAAKSIERDDHYRVIVVPFGLFQILKDTDIFDPGSDKFDLVRSFEYAVSPLHYTVNRDGTGTGAEFIQDLTNARLNRNLNAYRGFVPVTQPVGYGLAHPSFGGTIPVYKSDKVRHGIFVGAGPYFAMRGELNVDQSLVDILGSDTDVVVPPNTSLCASPGSAVCNSIGSDARGELALAITGGYRGRYAWPMSVPAHGERDGLYVAVNYSYLRGFRMEDGLIGVRFDTDATGQLTFNPALPPPIGVGRTSSDKGTGRVLDFGVAGLINHWELGFGVTGIGNQIKWTNVEGTNYTLGNLFTGGEFLESEAVPLPDVTIKQPLQYTTNAGYHADHWTVMGQYTVKTSDYAPDKDRLNTSTLHAGFEYRFLVLEPRGGVYYSRDRWQPAAGLGVNLGNFGIDGAVYSTDANVQRKRHAAFALSLRIGHKNP